MVSSPERVAPPPPKPSPLIAAPTKATTPKSLKAEAERVFKLADTSKDGKLDLNELAEITGFAKMGKSLMGKADSDGDGRLTIQEWVEYIESKGEQSTKTLQLYENVLTNRLNEHSASE